MYVRWQLQLDHSYAYLHVILFLHKTPSFFFIILLMCLYYIIPHHYSGILVWGPHLYICVILSTFCMLSSQMGIFFCRFAVCYNFLFYYMLDEKFDMCVCVYTYMEALMMAHKIFLFTLHLRVCLHLSLNYTCIYL